MTTAQNIANRTAQTPHWAYDPVLRSFNQVVFPETFVRQIETETLQSSNMPWHIHYGNHLLQIWSEVVIPSLPPLLDSSAPLSGSGILTLAFQLYAVTFVLTSVPPGAYQKPGSPAMYPHIGTLAFYSPLSGGAGLAEEEHLTMVAQTKFARKQVYDGIYYRLNPGYAGYFLFYGNPAVNLTQQYAYNTAPTPAEWKNVNVYSNQPVVSDAV